MTGAAQLIATLLATQPTIVDVGERAIAAVVLLAPGSTDAGLEARVLDATRTALHAVTGLTPVLARTLGARPNAVASCPPQRLLSCAVEVVEAREGDVTLLLIVSVLPIDAERVLARTIALDLPAARRALHAPRREEDDDAKVENRLYALALEGAPSELGRSDVAALSGYMRQLADALPPSVPGTSPPGTIELETPAGARELSLDDRALGEQPAGPLTLVNVRPGARVLRVVEGSGAVTERTLDVRSGHATRATLATSLIEPVEPMTDWRSTRSAVRWSGVALGAAGVVLTAVAAASGGGVRSGCLARASASAPSCEGLGTPTFAFDSSAAPTTHAADINPTALAPLSLGTGLLAAGLSWSVGTLVWGDDSDHPWWIVAGGLTLGAIGFGVVALAAP